MLDARLILVAGAGALGMFLGGAIWAVGGSAQGKALTDVDARLDAVATKARRPLDRPSDALARALATPLFGRVDPQLAQADVTLQLVGLVRTPTRAAALLGVGGAPPQWIGVGEESQGVLVQTVSNASVVVSTTSGEREIFMGPSSAPTVGSEAPPPGTRGPPPPASAPGMK